MAAPVKMKELSERMAGMDRPALIRLLRSIRCKFELDFTDEFLNSISLGRLRHIILAAGTQAKVFCDT